MARSVGGNAAARAESLYDPVTRTWTSPDWSEIALRLRLVDHGEQNGRQGFPPSDGDGWDEVHSRIDREVREIASRARDEVGSELARLRQQAAEAPDEVGLEAVAARIKGRASQAVGDLEARAAFDGPRLVGAVERLRHQETAMREFCERRHMTQRDPEGTGWSVAVCVLVAAFAVGEVGLNALLLAEGMRYGALGAAGLVAVVTVINIVVAFLAAMARHRTGPSVGIVGPVFGWLGVVAGIGALAAFNVFVGHFRDALREQAAAWRKDLDGLLDGAAVAGANGWERFLDNPIGYASAESALLSAMGFALALLLFWKFSGIRDPVPGYDARHAAVRRARGEHDDLRAAALDGLVELQDEAMRELAAEERRIGLAVQGAAQALQDAEYLVEAYAGQVAVYEAGGEQLVLEYRGANVRERSDAAPKWEPGTYRLPEGLTDPLRHSIGVSVAPDPVVAAYRDGVEAVTAAFRKARTSV